MFYYLADTDNDRTSLKEMTKALNEDITALQNDNLVYSYDSFVGPSHYSVPAHALPKAILEIFEIFQPISKKEYKEVILELNTSPTVYLQEKYQAINDWFGVDKTVLINDFKAIAAAIEKNETFSDYEGLGEMARIAYPETLLGGYYMGRFYEETGEPKKAMRTFQSAYTLGEIAGITKDEALKRAALIKEDFGF